MIEMLHLRLKRCLIKGCAVTILFVIVCATLIFASGFVSWLPSVTIDFRKNRLPEDNQMHQDELAKEASVKLDFRKNRLSKDNRMHQDELGKEASVKIDFRKNRLSKDNRMHQDEWAKTTEFYAIIHHTDVVCTDERRMGLKDDGGWWICNMPPYTLKQPCLVYSFGIERDWSFDDAISGEFGCDVFSFDPSLEKLKDHKRSKKVTFKKIGLADKDFLMDSGHKTTWMMKTLTTIRRDLGHNETVIDALKFDIEGWEIGVIRQMLKDGVLSSIKQIMFELHMRRRMRKLKTMTQEEKYRNFQELLTDLHNAGFVRYRTDDNRPTMKRARFNADMITTCCFEIYYVNLRYSKTLREQVETSEKTLDLKP